MELDKAIEKRHSVRSFKTKKPDYRKIIQAIDAANKAPLAGNISTLKFILIDNQEKIQELAKAAQQPFIKKVDYVVAVCSNNKEITRSYDERGLKYSKQQAGAAIQNFLLKITDLGLSTCWVGAFSDSAVKRILKIPDDIEIEAFFPIGYELSKSGQRKKPDLDNVLFFNEYKNKYKKPKSKPYA